MNFNYKSFFSCLMLALTLHMTLLSSGAWGATCVWNGTTSDMNLATNYTPNLTGTGAADDIVFSDASTANATATADLSVNSFRCAAGYTGNLSWAGFRVTTAGSFIDSGNGGTRNYGNGITSGDGMQFAAAFSKIHFLY